MKAIAEIVAHIKDEVRDAGHYALDSTKYKDIDNETADVYATLAEQELKHIEIVKKSVVGKTHQNDSGFKQPEDFPASIDIQQEDVLPDWQYKFSFDYNR